MQFRHLLYTRNLS